MTNDYEKKLAIKRAKADIRKALNDWHKFGTVSIDDILSRMGYSRNSYKFTKNLWTGMKSFTICLDTYGLIIKNSNNIDFEIK